MVGYEILVGRGKVVRRIQFYEKGVVDEKSLENGGMIICERRGGCRHGDENSVLVEIGCS